MSLFRLCDTSSSRYATMKHKKKSKDRDETYELNDSQHDRAESLERNQTSLADEGTSVHLSAAPDTFREHKKMKKRHKHSLDKHEQTKQCNSDAELYISQSREHDRGHNHQKKVCNDSIIFLDQNSLVPNEGGPSREKRKHKAALSDEMHTTMPSEASPRQQPQSEVDAVDSVKKKKRSLKDKEPSTAEWEDNHGDIDTSADLVSLKNKKKKEHRGEDGSTDVLKGSLYGLEEPSKGSKRTKRNNVDSGKDWCFQEDVEHSATAARKNSVTTCGEALSGTHHWDHLLDQGSTPSHKKKKKHKDKEVLPSPEYKNSFGEKDVSSDSARLKSKQKKHNIMNEYGDVPEEYSVTAAKKKCLNVAINNETSSDACHQGEMSTQASDVDYHKKKKRKHKVPPAPEVEDNHGDMNVHANLASWKGKKKVHGVEVGSQHAPEGSNYLDRAGKQIIEEPMRSDNGAKTRKAASGEDQWAQGDLENNVSSVEKRKQERSSNAATYSEPARAAHNCEEPLSQGASISRRVKKKHEDNVPPVPEGVHIHGDMGVHLTSSKDKHRVKVGFGDGQEGGTDPAIFLHSKGDEESLRSGKSKDKDKGFSEGIQPYHEAAEYDIGAARRSKNDKCLNASDCEKVSDMGHSLEVTLKHHKKKKHKDKEPALQVHEDGSEETTRKKPKCVIDCEGELEDTSRKKKKKRRHGIDNEGSVHEYTHGVGHLNFTEEAVEALPGELEHGIEKAGTGSTRNVKHNGEARLPGEPRGYELSEHAEYSSQESSQKKKKRKGLDSADIHSLDLRYDLYDINAQISKRDEQVGSFENNPRDVTTKINVELSDKRQRCKRKDTVVEMGEAGAEVPCFAQNASKTGQQEDVSECAAHKRANEVKSFVQSRADVGHAVDTNFQEKEKKRKERQLGTEEDGSEILQNGVRRVSGSNSLQVDSDFHLKNSPNNMKNKGIAGSDNFIIDTDLHSQKSPKKDRNKGITVRDNSELEADSHTHKSPRKDRGKGVSGRDSTEIDAASQPEKSLKKKNDKTALTSEPLERDQESLNMAYLDDFCNASHNKAMRGQSRSPEQDSVKSTSVSAVHSAAERNQEEASRHKVFTSDQGSKRDSLCNSVLRDSPEHDELWSLSNLTQMPNPQECKWVSSSEAGSSQNSTRESELHLLEPLNLDKDPPASPSVVDNCTAFNISPTVDALTKRRQERKESASGDRTSRVSLHPKKLVVGEFDSNRKDLESEGEENLSGEEDLFLDNGGYDSPADEDFQRYILETPQYPAIHLSHNKFEPADKEAYEQTTGKGVNIGH